MFNKILSVVCMFTYPTMINYLIYYLLKLSMLIFCINEICITFFYVSYSLFNNICDTWLTLTFNLFLVNFLMGIYLSMRFIYISFLNNNNFGPFNVKKIQKKIFPIKIARISFIFYVFSGFTSLGIIRNCATWSEMVESIFPDIPWV